MMLFILSNGVLSNKLNSICSHFVVFYQHFSWLEIMATWYFAADTGLINVFILTKKVQMEKFVGRVVVEKREVPAQRFFSEFLHPVT